MSSYFYSGEVWFNSPSHEDYPIRGIDVSNHQGDIDWQEVKSERVDFVYIKATEGMDYKDKYFEFNWDESDKAGLLRGAYHFFTFGSTGVEQAENFIEMVPYDIRALPPVIDLEFTGNSKDVPDKEPLQKELDNFIEAVKNHYNKEPIIYVTHESYETYIKGAYYDTPIWIRDIFRKPSLDDREEWLIWQYSNRGKVDGIDGFVDLNVFNGDRDRLDEMLCMVFSINEEIVINSNQTDCSEIVQETDDGFIFGRMKVYKEGDANSKTLYVPCIEKYNDEGELIWEKEFKYPLRANKIDNLEVFNDNSVVFTVIYNTNISEEKHEYYKSYLLKCDDNGKEIFKKDFKIKSFLPPKFVIGDKGEIYLIENKIDEGNITITKFGKEMDILKVKSFDSDDRFFECAMYNENIGIVVSVEYNMLFSETYGPGFIACFDENLSLLWKSSGYYGGGMKISNERIYATSCNQPPYISSLSQSTLNILDKNGNALRQINTSYNFVKEMNTLQDDILILLHDSLLNDYITIFNKYGDTISEIKGLEGRSSNIVITNDGGFILILQREVKKLEEPENSLRYLYDTECVVMKFDNEYRLERKKTYDMYKNVAQEDLVFPLSNGKLVIIEKELEMGN